MKSTSFFDIRKVEGNKKKERIFQAKLSLLGKNPIDELPDIISARALPEPVEHIKKKSPPFAPAPPVDVKN